MGSVTAGALEEVKRSDVKRFYNKLADERNLKIATIDNIHTVLHQVLELAVEDNYVRNNVWDNLLKELKQTHHFEDDHKRALTVPEHELFLEFLASEKTQYHHWYPIFAVMLGTIHLFIIIMQKMVVISASIPQRPKQESGRFRRSRMSEMHLTWKRHIRRTTI